MEFKLWLEDLEIKNALFGKLNIDKIHGLSTSINTWPPDKLINILLGLGIFTSLPQDVQDDAIGQIRSGSGTLGDLIQIMSKD
jgi:hypothetical protein